ncbi:predicted protein [Nematostella vectensis]|uniref:Uncharacterized protein n=1 Tax=Nematostella vectensis TaxID=45351 RepID=A7S5A6_NEMVE|nr:uncharacterized protein LOC5512809 [Nematostella vectensis]EDO41087.1 predicted protein [Nematostella vectensis]|eukprot:XP_001633150.1 predicted protein [Nematostella vectensis]
MFTSSMSIKRPYERETPFSWRPLPSKGTKKRNPDEDFILRGQRPSMRVKSSDYQTNTQRTISPMGSRSSLRSRTASAPCVMFKGYETTAEEFDPRDLSLDLSEFDDSPDEELMRLRDINYATNSFLNSSVQSDWFINPVHRSKDPPVNLDRLAQSEPLKASVLKSTAQGNIISRTDDVRQTPVDEFDMSVFRDAEEHMLSSRTLSGLSTPYRGELAQLKVKGLKLQEERLLKKKCLDELERIRGPKPRWYELKGPDFHREARKNNDLLSQSGHYDEIMQYRNTLLDALGEEKAPRASEMDLIHKYYHTKAHNQTI